MHGDVECNDQWPPAMARNRALVACCLLAVIALGLASRKYPALFPAVLGKYPGDTLWSMMVYCVWAFWKPSAPPHRVALGTLLISYLDELSQLIQLPWLNAFRQTTVGHLLLGTVFSWGDMLAYTVGVLLAVLLDSILRSLIVLRSGGA